MLASRSLEQTVSASIISEFVEWTRESKFAVNDLFLDYRIATTRSPFAIFGPYWHIFGNCGACSVNVPRAENLYQFSFEPVICRVIVSTEKD